MPSSFCPSVKAIHQESNFQQTMMIVAVYTEHCKHTLLIFQQCTYSQWLQWVKHWVNLLEYNGSCVPPLNEILPFECYPGGHYGRLPASMTELIKSQLTWLLQQLCAFTISWMSLYKISSEFSAGALALRVRKRLTRMLSKSPMEDIPTAVLK